MLHLRGDLTTGGAFCNAPREKDFSSFLFGSSTVAVLSHFESVPLSSVKAKYKLSLISSSIFTIVKMIKQKSRNEREVEGKEVH